MRGGFAGCSDTAAWRWAGGAHCTRTGVGVIDLATALEDQRDLVRLCTVPQESRVADLKTFNDFYGFATILKRFARYPEAEPVKAIIPHGVYYETDTMLDMELASQYRAVLNYPAFRADAWAAQEGRVVIPAASPFVYALSLFREAYPETVEGYGTLFIPAHTVQIMSTSANWSQVADELLALPDEYQPVTVIMYFHDYLKGLHTQFEQRGMRIVSAGHNVDPEFMFRWLHLLSQHRFVMSNDIGGGVLYAAKAGKPVVIMSELANAFYDPAVHAVHGPVMNRQARDMRDRIADLFRGDDETALAEVVDYLLGVENLKSPEQLHEDLVYAARLAEE